MRNCTPATAIESPSPVDAIRRRWPRRIRDHLVAFLIVMKAADSKFPLGKPINRPAPQPLRSIPGRPNWFVASRGVECYLEAPKTPAEDRHVVPRGS